eukprot:6594857-Pyramimonas_sp.AAC.2
MPSAYPCMSRFGQLQRSGWARGWFTPGRRAFQRALVPSPTVLGSSSAVPRADSQPGPPAAPHAR